MKTRDQLFNNLSHWVNALSITVIETLPEIKETLDGQKELPDSAPSKKSMALLFLSQIEKKFDEVEGAIEEIRKYIKNINVN